MAYAWARSLKAGLDELGRSSKRTIAGMIVPLLPLYIFGIFLQMTRSGQVAGVVALS